MKKILRLATRQSALALWQAHFVQDALSKKYPDCSIELVPFTTQGDRNTQVPLNAIGGKSLFTKELQQALLENKADFAVHSVKDMSAQETSGLTLTAIMEREDPRDAFVSEKHASLSALPAHAKVGTSSPRRVAELKIIRPDVEAALLRGNVPTRLQKLENSEFDAIILATAGLKRLGFEHKIKEYLNVDDFVPSIGQGALGIECRTDNLELMTMLSFLNHRETEICVRAERSVNQILGGDCYTPLGVYATIEKEEIFVRALLQKNETIVRHSLRGPISDAEKISMEMGNFLLKSFT